MRLKNEVNFCIIPEWILLADISPNAVRLYGILNRYAGKSRKATPSRATLAEHLRKSVRTVDSLIDELEGIQAIEVRKRMSRAGDPTSNEYLLKVTAPKDFAAKPLFDIDDEGVAQKTSLPPVDDTPEAGGGVAQPTAPPSAENFATPSSPLHQGGAENCTGVVQPTAHELEVLNEKVLNERNLATPSRSSESAQDRKTRRNEIWDALTDIFSEPETETEKRLRGSIVKELVAAGATGDEVKRRARMFATRFPGAAVTAPALRKWWGQLQPPNLSRTPGSLKQAEPEKCPHGMWAIAHCEDCANEGRYDQDGAA